MIPKGSRSNKRTFTQRRAKVPLSHGKKMNEHSVTALRPSNISALIPILESIVGHPPERRTTKTACNVEKKYDI